MYPESSRFSTGDKYRGLSYSQGIHLGIAKPIPPTLREKGADILLDGRLTQGMKLPIR